MSVTLISRYNVPELDGIRTAKVAYQGDSVPFTTAWVPFTDCDICVALHGTATAVTALVERTAVDPFNVDAQPVGVDGTSFAGNLSAGIVPNIYQETGVGWWRVRVTVVTGGTCDAAMSGF